MEIVNKFKPFRLSPLTKDVEDFMQESGEGEVVEYADLANVIDMDCEPGTRGYSYVLSAIRRLERAGCNFANIPNVGYRRLNPNETVDDNHRRIINSRKQIKRTLRRNEAVDYKRLGNVEKLEWQAATVFGKLAGRILSGRSKTKMIEAIKKQPDRDKIDYDGLAEIYLRKKGV